MANWMQNDVFALMKETKRVVRDLGLPAARLVELVQAVERGEISKQSGRELFRKLPGSTKPLKDLISESGGAQISDDSFIRSEVEAVVAEHAAVVEDLKKGKKNAQNFLVGQVMRRT